MKHLYLLMVFFLITPATKAWSASFFLSGEAIQQQVRQEVLDDEVEVCPDGVQIIPISAISVITENGEGIIRNALKNLKTYKFQNSFQLCFNVAGSEEIQLQTPIKINFTLDLPLVVSGLKLKLADSDEPVIQVDSNRKVILANMQIADSASAISLAGAGLHEVRDSVLTGKESGDGISISSDKAKVFGTEVSGFLDGIRVMANNVTIEESSSHDNKYGVHQLKEFSGLKAVKVISFNNVGQSQLENKASRAFKIEKYKDEKINFFTKQNGIIQEAKENEDGGIEFKENENAYLVPPKEVGDEFKVEFYLSDSAACAGEVSSLGQPCEYVNLNSEAVVTTEELDEAESIISLPPEISNKDLVAFFTGTKNGLLPVSTRFKFKSDGGKVPFVLIGAQPISLPSSPQAISEDNLARGEEVDVLEGEESIMSGASGLSGSGTEAAGLSSITSGAGGGAGGGCSLSVQGAKHKRSLSFVVIASMLMCLIVRRKVLH